MIERLLCGLLLLGSASMQSETVAEVIVRGSAARPAIERILTADNLDIGRLSPREVADAMAQIARGQAPNKFWSAYQKHVRAWQDFADAQDKSRAATSPMNIDHRPNGFAIADARKRINTTFDEVEVIAREYRARIPVASTRF